MPEGVVYPSEAEARRAAVLDRAIDGFLREGYLLKKRTRTTAILVTRRRGFSFAGWSFFGNQYLWHRATERDRNVYLSVDADANLVIRRA
jgi:hypothetical protein